MQRIEDVYKLRPYKTKLPNKHEPKAVWYDENVPEVVVSATHIHDEMVLNVLVFVTPTVVMTVFATAIGRLNTAWGNRDKGPEAQLELHNALAALIVMLTTLATYVNGIANGSESIILKAGMEPTFVERHPATPCGKADTPTGHSNPGGSLSLRVRKTAGASGYFWVAFLGAVVEPVIVGKQVLFPPNSGVVLIPNGRTIEEMHGLVGNIDVKIGVFLMNSVSVGTMSNLLTLSTQK